MKLSVPVGVVIFLGMLGVTLYTLSHPRVETRNVVKTVTVTVVKHDAPPTPTNKERILHDWTVPQTADYYGYGLKLVELNGIRCMEWARGTDPEVTLGTGLSCDWSSK